MVHASAKSGRTTTTTTTKKKEKTEGKQLWTFGLIALHPRMDIFFGRKVVEPFSKLKGPVGLEIGRALVIAWREGKIVFLGN